jgi:aminoglycoside phosphotransferase (APT) family kinase protein
MVDRCDNPRKMGDLPATTSTPESMHLKHDRSWPEREAWLAAAVGERARVVRTRPIGVSSTTMDAVDVKDRRGRIHRLALRRYTDAARLGTDPWYDPRNEARALKLLESSDVPAPRLVDVEPAGAVWGAPALLTSRIPGRTVSRPAEMHRFLGELARTLVRIHAVSAPAASGLLDYAPYTPVEAIFPPQWTTVPGLWERVLGVIARPPPSGPRGFIHRDYHPGQTLFVRGRLRGVVDWTSACTGPPDIDLARMRINLAWDFGPAVADRFLSAFATESGRAGPHPYWELVDCADCLPDMDEPRTDDEQRELRRFERHVASLAAAFG